jgi:hypothetical protein
LTFQNLQESKKLSFELGVELPLKNLYILRDILKELNKIHKMLMVMFLVLLERKRKREKPKMMKLFIRTIGNLSLMKKVKLRLIQMNYNF